MTKNKPKMQPTIEYLVNGSKWDSLTPEHKAEIINEFGNEWPKHGRTWRKTRELRTGRTYWTCEAATKFRL